MTITLRRDVANDCWTASSDAYRDLFGQETVPTAFRASALAGVVETEVRLRNPDAVVQIACNRCGFVGRQHFHSAPPTSSGARGLAVLPAMLLGLLVTATALVAISYAGGHLDSLTALLCSAGLLG